jgi:hypothetical protein
LPACHTLPTAHLCTSQRDARKVPSACSPWRTCSECCTGLCMTLLPTALVAAPCHDPAVSVQHTAPAAHQSHP